MTKSSTDFLEDSLGKMEFKFPHYHIFKQVMNACELYGNGYFNFQALNRKKTGIILLKKYCT